MTWRGESARPESASAVGHRDHRALFLVELFALLALALGIRVGALHQPNNYDELYHLLAAKSLVMNGTTVIGDGEPYTRATGFTYLVAGVFKLAGVGMTQLRLVPLVCGTLTVGLLFAWLHRVAGHLTAWIAGVLLALDPESVFYSTAGRFYALQTLLFLAAVVGAWWSTLPERSPRTRAAGLAGAAVALAGTVHLQIASVLGAVLVAVWVALILAWTPFTNATPARRRRWVATIGVALVALVAAAWLTGMAGWAARMSAFVPAWALEEQHEIRFYYWAMLLDYPLLVALLPVFVLLALERWPREASLCVLVAGGVLAYHSLAAFKATRFVLYVVPLWLTVSVMGLTVLLEFVGRRMRELSERLMPALSDASRRRLSGVALAGMLLFALLATPGFTRVRRLVTDPDTDPWQRTSAQLRRLVDGEDVVIGAARLPMLYFVGRIDGVLERPDVSDPDRELDGFDRQVGKPVVATLPAFEAVVARYPRGLVVADSIHWRRPWAVRDSLADYIEHTLERVPVGDPRILVFRWSRTPMAMMEGRP